MTLSSVPSLGGRRNVADQISDTLRELILRGELAPGTALNQAQLANRLSASTTPVREALLKLTAEGFIAAEPHRAFRVVRMSRQDVLDVFWLHGQVAAELAVRTFTERGAELAAELEAAHDDYVAAVQRDDAAQIVEINWRFHRLLNAAADSARLRWTLRSLLRLTPSGFYRDRQDWVGKSVASHAAIVDAAREGRTDHLRTAVTDHIDSARDDFLSHLEAVAYWERPAADASS